MQGQAALLIPSGMHGTWHMLSCQCPVDGNHAEYIGHETVQGVTYSTTFNTVPITGTQNTKS